MKTLKISSIVFIVLAIMLGGYELVIKTLAFKSHPVYYDTDNFVVIGTQAPGNKVLAESLKTGGRIEGEPTTTLTNGQLVVARYTYKCRPVQSNFLGDEIPASTNVIKTEFVPIDPVVLKTHR